jgi:hypothetical protein
MKRLGLVILLAALVLLPAIPAQASHGLGIRCRRENRIERRHERRAAGYGLGRFFCP